MSEKPSSLKILAYYNRKRLACDKEKAVEQRKECADLTCWFKRDPPKPT